MGEEGRASVSSQLFCAGAKARNAFYPILYRCLLRIYRYSILPALTQNGIIYCNVVEGSFNGGSFKDFVAGVLTTMNPFPGPKSVLVMDNCGIHKNKEIRRLVESRFVF
jgi:hypothetical protein